MVTITFVRNGVIRPIVRNVECDISSIDSVVSLWKQRGYVLLLVHYNLNLV